MDLLHLWMCCCIVFLTILNSACSDGNSSGGGFYRDVCEFRTGAVFQRASKYRHRLQSLRDQMQIRATLQGPEIDAYILPSYDEHLNRDVAAADKRLEFISGFTGIDAVAAITMKKAAIWVKQRYIQQAHFEIDCDWEIFYMNGSVGIADWLGTHLYADQRIGADPHLIPHQDWIKWEADFSNKLLFLAKINTNIVDLIWGGSRPEPVQVKIKVQEQRYAGEKWEDKVIELRKELRKHQCDSMIVTSLTEIAYLLNIRGRDIPYTPVVKSYLIVSHDQIFFYVDRNKLNLNIAYHLKTDCHNEMCVKILPYHEVWNDLRTYAQIWKKVLVPAPCVQDLGASEAVFSALPLNLILYKISPIIFMRALKNVVEQRGMRRAHIRDGSAIAEGMSNLEDRFFTEDWTEEKIKYEIERSRHSQSNAKGLSLRTVVAFGDHSSYPYYISSNITDIEVSDQSTLVIESGSQYFEGTTDVSRTYIFGEPTAEMKRAYTNILIGVLELTHLMFPFDMRPSELDVLVRKPVWSLLNDYPQATGHGIGAYGSVEEPPISVAYGAESAFHLKEGYFFSSESGFYKPGEYGIRLKNVLEVVDTGKKLPTGSKLLTFKDVTLVPYEPKLIDGSLLNKNQKTWLKEYNAKIREYVGEELKQQHNMQAFYWMMNKTRHISEYNDNSNSAGGSNSGIRSFLTVTVPALLLGLTVFGSFLKWLI